MTCIKTMSFKSLITKQMLWHILNHKFQKSTFLFKLCAKSNYDKYSETERVVTTTHLSFPKCDLDFTFALNATVYSLCSLRV